MSCSKVGLFLTGVVFGAGVALLLAPESGEELRKRIRKQVKKLGLPCCSSEDEIDAIVEELAEEIESK